MAAAAAATLVSCVGKVDTQGGIAIDVQLRRWRLDYADGRWLHPAGAGYALPSSGPYTAYAQSSHCVSATMSSVSTVAPHQIRSPGGASR